MKHLIVVVLLCCVISAFGSEVKKARTNPRRHRSLQHFPKRRETSAAFCGPHEYHTLCGHEHICDLSCMNMLTPPNCITINNPRCYYPRCLCEEGFVREKNGACVKPSHCPFDPELPKGFVPKPFRRLRRRRNQLRRKRL